MAQGAEITERVQKLFALVGLCEKPAVRETPKKSAPKAKAQERMKAEAEAKAAAEEAARAEAEAAAAAAEEPKAE
jgi:small subunit ribosomal protein S16